VVKKEEISTGFRWNGLGSLGWSNDGPKVPPKEAAPLAKVKNEEKEK
jgi:hypothetical protein